MHLQVTYNEKPITVNIFDAINPLFCTKDIYKALGKRPIKAEQWLTRYNVISLATRRNKPEYTLFRKWFVSEFRFWFEPGYAATTSHPVTEVEEIDEEDVANYILSNV